MALRSRLFGLSLLAANAFGSDSDPSARNELIPPPKVPIRIVPSISAPSVKDGGKLSIQASVTSLAGVREVKAEIRDGARVIDTIGMRPGLKPSGENRSAA